MTPALCSRKQRLTQNLANSTMFARPEPSTEMKLLAGNQIHDDPAILYRLGFSGKLPAIPVHLVERCAQTGNSLVLSFPTTLLEYQAKLNKALGSRNKHLGLIFVEDGASDLAIKNEEPAWIVVPNKVRDDTLGLAKEIALSRVPNGATYDPMNTVLLLGYNNLKTGQQMPGFKNKWTFTSREDTMVGSAADGIRVNFARGYDRSGNFQVGLAA